MEVTAARLRLIDNDVTLVFDGQGISRTRKALALDSEAYFIVACHYNVRRAKAQEDPSALTMALVSELMICCSTQEMQHEIWRQL